MNSAETLNVLIARDVYLEPEEMITWIGRPAKQPFLIANYRTLIQWLLLTAGFYLFSRLSCFRNGSGFTSLFLFVCILAIVHIHRAIKNIRGHDKLLYLITSHRIIIARPFAFQRLICIPANELQQIMVRQSATDENYGTASFELDSGKTEPSDGDDIKVYDYFHAVADPHIPLQLLEDIIAANKQRPA